MRKFWRFYIDRDSTEDVTFRYFVFPALSVTRTRHLKEPIYVVEVLWLDWVFSAVYATAKAQSLMYRLLLLDIQPR